jgi:hypothetical protein
MKKNKLFVILAMITIILLLATAAICNQCSFQGDAGKGLEQSTDSADKSKDTDNKSNGSKQDDGKSKDDNKGGKDKSSGADSKIEITDIVVGDVIDEHVEPVDILFTNSTYTCYPVLVDPPDGSETYDWDVSGGTNDNGSFYMQWETPPDEGTYSITLGMRNGAGVSGSKSVDITINPDSALGEPPQGPVIQAVNVLGADPGPSVATFAVYTIEVIADDPASIVDHYDFDAGCGNLLVKNNNIIEWESPDFEGDCDITAHIVDIDGNFLDSKTITVTVVRPL